MKSSIDARKIYLRGRNKQPQNNIMELFERNK
jgi:hypothetical protein